MPTWVGSISAALSCLVREQRLVIEPTTWVAWLDVLCVLSLFELLSLLKVFRLLAVLRLVEDLCVGSLVT